MLRKGYWNAFPFLLGQRVRITKRMHCILSKELKLVCKETNLYGGVCMTLIFTIEQEEWTFKWQQKAFSQVFHNVQIVQGDRLVDTCSMKRKCMLILTTASTPWRSVTIGISWSWGQMMSSSWHHPHDTFICTTGTKVGGPMGDSSLSWTAMATRSQWHWWELFSALYRHANMGIT